MRGFVVASGGSAVFVDQPVQYGFSADSLDIEVDCCDAGNFALIAGNPLGDALMRPGRVVVGLVLVQDRRQSRDRAGARAARLHLRRRHIHDDEVTEVHGGGPLSPLPENRRTFRKYSTTAYCSPPHVPRNGTSFSRARRTAS